jgi:hypothetical protein
VDILLGRQSLPKKIAPLIEKLQTKSGFGILLINYNYCIVTNNYALSGNMKRF